MGYIPYEAKKMSKEIKEITIFEVFDKDEFKNLRTLLVHTRMGDYTFLIKHKIGGTIMIYSNHSNNYAFKFWLDKNNNLLFSKFQQNTAKFSYGLEEIGVDLYGIVSKGESVLSPNVNISMDELNDDEILYVISEEPLQTVKFKFQNSSFLRLFSLEELIAIYTLYEKTVQDRMECAEANA